MIHGTLIVSKDGIGPSADKCYICINCELGCLLILTYICRSINLSNINIKVMKKLIIVLSVLLGIIAFTSCDTDSDTGVTSSATSVGAAINTLYQSYQSGEEITSVANIIPLATLVTGASVYKENYTDLSYYTAFSSGVISGSSGIVSDDNVDNVLGSLLSIANLTGDDTTGEETSSLDVVSILSSLFLGM